MSKLIGALAIHLLFCSATLFSQSIDKIVLKQKDLEQISLIRLSDIYSVLPQLDIYTLDGYRHSISGGRLFDNSPQNINVKINGIQTSFGFLNHTNFNQFPVHPNNIDSIIIELYPAIYEGDYFSGVLIDIITKTPAESLSLIGTFSTGNETGDPGPYRYSEYFSGNVDQFGPNHLFSASYGGRNYDLTFDLVDQVSPATDEAILKRVNNFVFQNYQIRYFGASFNLKFKSRIGEHRLFTVFNKTGDAVLGSVYGADLLYFDELGYEIPFQSENLIISSGNKIEISENTNLSLDFNANYLAAEQSELYSATSFSLEDLVLYSKAGLSTELSGIKLQLGSSISFYRMVNPVFDKSFEQSIPSFFISVALNSFNRLSHKFDANIRSDERQGGFFLNIENRFEPDEKSSLMLTFSAGNLTDIDNSVRFREENGIRLFNNIGFQNPDLKNKSFFTSLRFNFTHKPISSLLFGFGGALFSRFDLSYMSYDFTYSGISQSIIKSDRELVEIPEGTNLVLSFSANHNITDNIFHRYFYRYRKALSDDQLYEDVMARIPEHRILYSLYFRAYDDLLFTAIINYWSGSKWIEFRNITDAQNDIYNYNPQSMIIADIGVIKSFWRNNIRVSAMIKNLFNDKVQYHPIGGTFDLTFFLKVEARLNSIF